MAQLPRGTVTFLFTDIEGSTRLWATHPAAMPVANARHEVILREAIARHGGALYKVTGDSFQSAFATAPAAVAAAYEAQRALVAEPWPALGMSEPLRARIALHVSAVDPGDDDYRTPGLNRLGRLLDAGYGGQVLLSAAVQALVWENLPPQTALRDLGEHRLKDLTQPSRIYQLVAPDLPDTFPPLRTLERYPHNLPLLPTSFLGRERELAAVSALLRSPDARLLTLTGSGGTGKTRLSLAAAGEVLADYPDGVWFVDLSVLTDADLVPSAIAQAAGIREERARPLPVTLAEALHERRTLLVLDNFEHVLPAAPVVAALLASAPGLQVLVTSREPLHLRGEREFPVPSFGAPDPRDPEAMAQLTQYEAVRLFIARAQDVRPDFAVDSENAPAVAEICHRLDGLPLAIELAAARIKLLPLEALRRRLEQRLTLLTSGTRDVPERQRTLRAAIDWSYDLISAEEQALFRQVAVFAGGFTLETAERVIGSSHDLMTLDLIASLVDKSLLRQSEGKDGEPRFSMLETIREYALERLQGVDEAADIHRRHAASFLDLAREADPHITGRDPGRWLDQLETEHDNMRAALRWALELGGDAEIGLRLAAALSRFWFIRGYLFEGRQWLGRALAAGQGIAGDARSAAVQAAASLAWGQGDRAGAGVLYEEALRLATEQGDAIGMATSFGNLGLVAQDLREYDRAREHFQQAIAVFRELGETRRLAGALLNLGTFHYMQEDLDQAEEILTEGLALAREVGNTRTAALCLLNLGTVATDRGDEARAATLLGEALALFRAFGDQRGIASCLNILGDLAAARGDRLAAAGYLDEALSLLQAVGDKRGLAGCLDSVARLVPPSVAAARLLAAATAFDGTAGAAASEETWPRDDEGIATVRQALGETAFAAAWRAGAAMSLEEAVDAARAALADADGDSPHEVEQSFRPAEHHLILVDDQQTK
jgi:predicted ATPase/class 3 adenylate cyclase/Tfp pilus assembly protein PilF